MEAEEEKKNGRNCVHVKRKQRLSNEEKKSATYRVAFDCPRSFQKRHSIYRWSCSAGPGHHANKWLAGESTGKPKVKR